MGSGKFLNHSKSSVLDDIFPVLFRRVLEIQYSLGVHNEAMEVLIPKVSSRRMQSKITLCTFLDIEGVFGNTPPTLGSALAPLVGK